MFQALKLLPGHVLGIEGELVGIFGIGLLALLVVLVPFIDSTPGPGDRRSRLISIGAIVVLGIAAWLTVLAYLPSAGAAP